MAVLMAHALLFSVYAEAETIGGCTITTSRCHNFPEFDRSQFRDALGEEELRTASVASACMKRAEDFYHWCGNTDVDGETAGVATVAATHDATSTTQVYHAAACDRGWSLFDRWCYRHIWEQKNWPEAEASCRDVHSGHLISVHSAAENNFAHELTYGLSAWIGYTDVDKDTHYEWSDSTQNDFSNMAKNCTGRETEPDCTPESKSQQWYNAKGDKRLTFVCKRDARLPVALLNNVSAADVLKDWSRYSTAISTLPSRTSATVPTLKTNEKPQVVPSFTKAAEDSKSVPKPMALKMTTGLL